MYAESILIKDKKIFKVGKKDDLLKVASDDVELINLQGKTLIPAFIDATVISLDMLAHLHK